jgi:TolB-like protein
MGKGLLLWGVMVAFTFSACASSKPVFKGGASETEAAVSGEPNLVNVSYDMADSLISNLREPLARNKIILVASFVDVRYMQRSSNFGRMMSEYVCSRLGQKGYKVIELKLRNAIYVREKGGEFLLSRSVKEISHAHGAQAVVVGTYAQAMTNVYISARVVQADGGEIISSCDIKLPLDVGLRSMLHSS